MSQFVGHYLDGPDILGGGNIAFVALHNKTASMGEAGRVGAGLVDGRLWTGRIMNSITAHYVSCTMVAYTPCNLGCGKGHPNKQQQKLWIEDLK